VKGYHGRWPIAIVSFCVVVATLFFPNSGWAHSPPIIIELNVWGNPILYRDGVEQDYWGLTGTGLPKAFEGVPQAVALAERYQWWVTGGNIASVVGNVMFSAGIWYRLKEGLHRTQRPASWGLVLGGGALAAGGAVSATVSKRLIYQAVNIFNDRYDPQNDPKIAPEFRTQFSDAGHPEGQMLLTMEFGK
jgi:hypothetical protein